MLESMTGFASVRREADALQVAAEIRSVNGRFLNVVVRAPPVLGAQEHELEALVRQSLARGSVTLSITLTRLGSEAGVSVNEEAVLAYQRAFRRLGLSEQSIPLLPGVVGATEWRALSPEQIEAVFDAVRAALEELVAMRRREGAALGKTIVNICERMRSLGAGIRERVPEVVRAYQQRLTERLAALTQGGALNVDPQLVAREVALMGERSDVAEELDRLASHLGQACGLLSRGGAVGRTLDFLGQELLREANTISSKSVDAQISQRVVDLKSEIERLREQVANLQ